jgi:hypothetical protein
MVPKPEITVPCRTCINDVTPMERSNNPHGPFSVFTVMSVNIRGEYGLRNILPEIPSAHHVCVQGIRPVLAIRRIMYPCRFNYWQAGYSISPSLCVEYKTGGVHDAG